MRLSEKEFKSLVRVQWIEKINKFGDLYYTPVDETSTRLFNMDLLKKIIAKRFQSQQAITSIPNYDISQPVILFPDLTLKLTPDIEIINNTALALTSIKINTFRINLSNNEV